MTAVDDLDDRDLRHTDDPVVKVEFPPLHTDDEEEEFGRLVSTRDDPLDALTAAEDVTGAERGRWVNADVVHDEYLDYVVAGRLANSALDENPWPVPLKR